MSSKLLITSHLVYFYWKGKESGIVLKSFGCLQVLCTFTCVLGRYHWLLSLWQQNVFSQCCQRPELFGCLYSACGKSLKCAGYNQELSVSYYKSTHTYPMLLHEGKEISDAKWVFNFPLSSLTLVTACCILWWIIMLLILTGTARWPLCGRVPYVRAQ